MSFPRDIKFFGLKKYNREHQMASFRKIRDELLYNCEYILKWTVCNFLFKSDSH